MNHFGRLFSHFPPSFLPNQHIRSSSPLSLVTRQLIMDERSFSRECVSLSLSLSYSPFLRGYLSTDFLLKGSTRRIMIHVIDSDGKQSSFHILFSSCSLLPPSYAEFYEPCHFELSFSFGKVMASNEPNPPLLRLQTQPKILVKCYEFWCYSKMLRSVSCCKCGLYKLQINRTQFHTVQ